MSLNFFCFSDIAALLTCFLKLSSSAREYLYRLLLHPSQSIYLFPPKVISLSRLSLSSTSECDLALYAKIPYRSYSLSVYSPRIDFAQRYHKLSTLELIALTLAPPIKSMVNDIIETEKIIMNTLTIPRLFLTISVF